LSLSGIFSSRVSFFSWKLGEILNIWARSDNLWHLGRFCDGKMLGTFWRGCLGGGYITGVSEDNQLSGNGIAYLFPNLTDGVLGRWEGGKLVAGHRVRLAGVAREAGLAVAVFSTPLCPQVLVRDRSTAHSISTSPLSPDPLEHSRVEVRASNTETAGEGLFAKTGFSTGDLVCPQLLFTVYNCSLLWRCPY